VARNSTLTVPLPSPGRTLIIFQLKDSDEQIPMQKQKKCEKKSENDTLKKKKVNSTIKDLSEVDEISNTEVRDGSMAHVVKYHLASTRP
jgi:hypothetical protein